MSDVSRTNKLFVPFWEKKYEDTNLQKTRFYLKKVLFYFKCVVYFFLGFMIIWSFLQSVSATWTNYSPNPGEGMEFGYLPGKNGVGDNRFDLGSWAMGPKYQAFYQPETIFGPFLSWFVYPISKLFIGIVYHFSKTYPALSPLGLDVVFGMIIIMFCMRFISFWSTLRSSIYTEKQTYHQSQLEQINLKYNKFSPADREAKYRKHKEIQQYNKKHGLRPLVPFENFFISTPIFLIVFKVVTITRPVKFAVLFGIWDLSKTPSSMVFNSFMEGGWMYFLLCLIIIPVNFISQRTGNWFTQLRHPQTKHKVVSKDSPTYKFRKVQQLMTVVFLLFTFFWSTSLAVYYFFNSLFTIFQNYLIHLILKKMNSNRNVAQEKLKKLGLNV